MDKQEAIARLGGKPSTAARLIWVTVAAISNWPEKLPPRIVDRVQAVLWRESQKKKRRVKADSNA